jgi:hypothetical protein
MRGSFVRKRDIKQYSISILVTIVLFFVCLELYAHYKSNHGISGNEVRILYEEKFPVINKFLADKRLADNAGLSYYDYFLFSMAPTPIKSELMTFTHYYSARNVPDSAPIGSNAPIVWLFGGSTMQNMETTDELSIANQVAVNLKKAGHLVTVVNFGVGGFQSSLESIKFQELLRQIPANERPAVVIFYDGFNDAVLATLFKAGGYQNDLAKKIEALVVGHHGKMFFYSLGNLVGKLSTYWKNELAFKYSRAIFGEDFIKYDHDNLIKAVEIYEINSRMIRGVCREFGIKPIFLLQPMIYTKNNWTDFEKKISLPSGNEKVIFMKEFYRLASKSMKKYDDFFDLSGILNESKRNDFYDLGHTGPFTGITIGKHIEQILEPYLLNNN